MPKKVDHTTRRMRIAEALWRVARRDGIHATSVRSVAAEAHLSPTALRYFFATQDELLEFAMSTTAQRVSERVVPLMEAAVDGDGVRRLLEELLPLDEDRRLEQEVYLAFLMRARQHSGLRAIGDEVESRLHGIVRHAVDVLHASGELGDGGTAEDAVERTYALIDGLAFQGALWPRQHPPAQLRRTLHRHLETVRTRRSR